MIKTGEVKEGKSPSAVSSKPAELIKSGEALCAGEDAPRKAEDLDVAISEEELHRG